MKWIDRLKSKIKQESKLNLAINAIILCLLVLMLIPSTRREILPPIQRLFLFAPSIEDEPNRHSLSDQDYLWKYQDANGQVKSLEYHRGKVIFFNLWATWCPPCVAELPSINQLYSAYKDKVEFVFISNEPKETVAAFLQKKGYAIQSGKMLYQLPKTLLSESLPTTYIIDKEGKIVVHKVGTAKWNSQKVRTLLDKLIEE